MTANDYDIVIIGSGPGGYVAATRAAQQGFKTLCIEKDKTLGGTCLNVGCIPSKAHLQSTEALTYVQKQASDQGLEVGSVKPDFEKMMRRKEQVVKSLTDGVQGIFKRNRVTWMEGAAKIVGHHEIQIKTAEGE